MKHFNVLWIILITILCLIQTPTIARPNPPVAMLVNGSGTLTFSKDGDQWTPINRNKLLFNGDYVKTGHDGSCKLIFHDAQFAKYIENNSHAIVKDNDLELLAGNVSDSNAKTFNLFDNLKRKFAVIHRYTTVQRSTTPQTSFTLPELLVISNQYPTVAWENLSPEYHYRFIFQGTSNTIPKSDQEIIRYNLSNYKPGKHEYTLCVMDNDKELYRKSASILCLSKKESEKIFQQEQRIRQISDQGFLLGHYMDEQGLKVPALDYYQRFFENGSYDVNIYPFLIKVYDDLGMKRIAKQKIRVFNQQRK
jgi:hypothetical protein